MEKEFSQSPQNVIRAARQKLESLERAGVTHVPKAKTRSKEQGAGSKPAPIDTKRADTTATPSRRARPEPTAAPREAAISQFKTPCSPLPVPLPLAPGQSREDALAAVAKRVAACERCPVLVRNRTQTVFGVGNPRTRLVFVGEAPGADEDRQGEPFVGRAGQLLTDIITKGMKLRREDVYIMNILRCRPPDNRTPLPLEAANCREYLDAQLAIIQPQYICCLGACAAQNLLGVDTPIGKLRGRMIDFNGMKVLCTYHPAYVLRNPPAKRQVWDDIQVLMKEMGLDV